MNNKTFKISWSFWRSSPQVQRTQMLVGATFNHPRDLQPERQQEHKRPLRLFSLCSPKQKHSPYILKWFPTGICEIINIFIKQWSPHGLQFLIMKCWGLYILSIVHCGFHFRWTFLFKIFLFLLLLVCVCVRAQVPGEVRYRAPQELELQATMSCLTLELRIELRSNARETDYLPQVYLFLFMYMCLYLCDCMLYV